MSASGILRRVAVVGTGHRAGIFLEAMATALRNDVAIAALCEPNPFRLDHYRRTLREAWDYPHPVAVFGADEFDRMIAESRPTDVLVCTPDHLHAQITCRALEAGCDVVVEKPLAIDTEGCNRIMETAARTGRKVRVAFNCRFMPSSILVKKLLGSGVIGEVICGSLNYMIGAAHGASYFARWHAQKALSGGLLVHKASHHFDLINWWLDGIPDTLFAAGRRGFFGAENKKKHGITNRASHYLDEETGNDPFREVFVGSASCRDLHLGGAAHDGYRADRSVWRDDDMDIEDAMSVTLRYRAGPVFAYTLNAFSPFAGFHLVLNGIKGRLELRTELDASLGPIDGKTAADPAHEIVLGDRCAVYPLYGAPYEVAIPAAEGGHDGSDPVMMKELFSPAPVEDPLGRHAGPEQGAASALTGIAANRSIAEGRSVALEELTTAFGRRARLGDLA